MIRLGNVFISLEHLSIQILLLLTIVVKRLYVTVQFRKPLVVSLTIADDVHATCIKMETNYIHNIQHWPKLPIITYI